MILESSSESSQGLSEPDDQEERASSKPLGAVRIPGIASSARADGSTSPSTHLLLQAPRGVGCKQSGNPERPRGFPLSLLSSQP